MALKARISNKLNDEVKSMHAAGLSITEIATHFGCYEGGIRRIVDPDYISKYRKIETNLSSIMKDIYSDYYKRIQEKQKELERVQTELLDLTENDDYIAAKEYLHRKQVKDV